MFIIYIIVNLIFLEKGRVEDEECKFYFYKIICLYQ